MDNEISVQTDNASLVPYVQSKDGTNDETTYERRTMRDISRGQNKKKDGHKYVLVVKFMGLWAPAAAFELVTKKSRRVFKSPM